MSGRFVRQGLAVFLALLAGGCEPLFHPQVAGTAFEIRGDVSLADANGRRRLTNSAALAPGAEINTAAEASADLALLPGIWVELAGDTKISVTALRFSKDGDETIQPVKSRKAIFSLDHGTLLLSIDWAQAPSHATMKCTLGVLTADSRSAAEVRLRDGKLHVMCLRGAVNFTPGQSQPLNVSPTRIGAGFFAAWPDSPEPRAAARSGFAAQRELGEILQAEKKLRQRADAAPLGIDPWKNSAH